MKKIIKTPYICGICWADIDPDARFCEYCGARFGDEVEVVSEEAVRVVRKEIETEKEINKQKFQYDIRDGKVIMELVQDPSTGKVVGSRPRIFERRHELLSPPTTTQTKVICAWCGNRFTIEEMKRHYLKCFEGDEKPTRRLKKPK